MRLSVKDGAEGGRDGRELGGEMVLLGRRGRGSSSCRRGVGRKLMGVGEILFRLIGLFVSLLRDPACRIDFVHAACGGWGCARRGCKGEDGLGVFVAGEDNGQPFFLPSPASVSLTSLALHCT